VPHRWKSVAATVIGHAVLLYALFFVVTVVPKKLELQTITVSITQTRVSQPEPAPPVPKIEQQPVMLQPKLPQIDTPAQPRRTPSWSRRRCRPRPTQDAKEKNTQEAPVSRLSSTPPISTIPRRSIPTCRAALREVGTVQLRVRVQRRWHAAGDPARQVFRL
jgi:hypothetical protein